MRTNILATAVALSDRDLLARIGDLAGRERETTAELVAHLAALEMRPSVYAAQGYGSLFDYCTGALRLSEDAACNRIEAARACTRCPVILELLAGGALTLTSVRKLRSHLTQENHEAVLRKAANQNKEQIEALIAEVAPKRDVPSSVRKLPVADVRTEEEALRQPSLLGPGSNASTPMSVPGTCLSEPATCLSEEGSALEIGDPRCAVLREPMASLPPTLRVPRPIVQALAPERYRVQFTIGQETHDRLRRVQALMRRQIPSGDPAAIFDRALRLLEEVERKKLGFTAKAGRRGRDVDRNYENRIRSGTDETLKEVRIPGGSAGTLTGALIDPALPRRVDPSRHVPNGVKRAVWRRDAGQCAFVSDAGHRCTERSFLELHHIQPYAMNGPATVSNISLRCRRHNQYEGEAVFGPRTSRIALKSEEQVT
jgi:hypothetical protein